MPDAYVPPPGDDDLSAAEGPGVTRLAGLDLTREPATQTSMISFDDLGGHGLRANGLGAGQESQQVGAAGVANLGPGLDFEAGEAAGPDASGRDGTADADGETAAGRVVDLFGIGDDAVAPAHRTADLEALGPGRGRRGSGRDRRRSGSSRDEHGTGSRDAGQHTGRLRAASRGEEPHGSRRTGSAARDDGPSGIGGPDGNAPADPDARAESGTGGGRDTREGRSRRGGPGSSSRGGSARDGSARGDSARDGSARDGSARNGSARGDSARGGSAGNETTDPVAEAKTICLRLLEGRARTRQELAQALRRKGIPDEAAEVALGRFSEVGLIDDAAFAGQWVRSRHTYGGLGRRAIAQELRRKGVDPDTAGEALAEVDEESEEARARALVDRKLRTRSGVPDETTARRLLGMLARKGYPAAIAYRVVREAVAEHAAELAEQIHTDDS